MLRAEEIPADCQSQIFRLLVHFVRQLPHAGDTEACCRN
jgi:hypothetical protein